MSFKDMLKWGNKLGTGSLILTLSIAISLILFLNRFDLILIQNEFTDLGIKENVKYWQTGILQLLRSFLEHISFNFLLPLIFVIISLGSDRLFNKYFNWRIIFAIGAITAIICTLQWELQHRPIEIIEIIYDFGAVYLSYLFINWMLKEFDENTKIKNNERELLDIDIKKLNKEDRIFLLNINHNELLFNESMLLQNRFLVLAIFALFVALLSLIIPLQSISNILKIVVVAVFSYLALYLLYLFLNALKRVRDQNKVIKNSYNNLFSLHLNYSSNKASKKKEAKN